MNSRRRRGMTFLEIMVVVTILSVLALMAMPSMRGPHERNKLRAAAREIVSQMRYARSAAILNEAIVVMEFDASKARYRMDLGATRENLDNDSGFYKGKFSERREEMEYWRALEDNVFFSAVDSRDNPEKKNAAARVCFYPDGSASDARVALGNNRGKFLTIIINRATARMEIRDGPPEDDASAESEETS